MAAKSEQGHIVADLVGLRAKQREKEYE